MLEALAAAHKTILTWEMHETAQEWQRQSTNGHSHNGADIAEAASKVPTCLVQAYATAHSCSVLRGPTDDASVCCCSEHLVYPKTLALPPTC